MLKLALTFDVNKLIAYLIYLRSFASACSGVKTLNNKRGSVEAGLVRRFGSVKYSGLGQVIRQTGLNSYVRLQSVVVISEKKIKSEDRNAQTRSRRNKKIFVQRVISLPRELLETRETNLRGHSMNLSP